MRRSVLSTFLALGVVLTAIGGTGLFAVVSDTARTGTNNASSGALAPVALTLDLQLATATLGTGGATCGTFAEDLSSGFFAVGGVQPGTIIQGQFFCLRNLGSQVANLTVRVEELADVEQGCTGDESQHDPSCGGGPGELSEALTANFAAIAPCTGSPGAPLLSSTQRLTNLTTPVSLGTLAAGATGCYQALLAYPTTTQAIVTQRAQSDQVTWRYAFSGQG